MDDTPQRKYQLNRDKTYQFRKHCNRHQRQQENDQTVQGNTDHKPKA